MNLSIGTTAWGALIGVCGMSKTDADVAKHAATRLLELDPLNAPGHVCDPM